MDNGYDFVSDRGDTDAIFNQPQLLIQLKNKKMEICSSTLKQIQNITTKIAVTSIIGPYRSGKSWLLSILAECPDRKGYTVSDGMTSCTKGVWVYCRRHPNTKDIVQLFCDTEGLGDAFKENASSEDNYLFTAAFLISKILIYNVKGVCDYGVLEKLAFVSTLSDKIQVTAAKKVCPEFILVLRDVNQTKLKLNGEAVSGKKYLQSLLNDGPGKSLGSTRKSIQELCPSKACFTITYPTKNPDDWDDLNEKPYDDLQPDFKDDISSLKKYINDSSVEVMDCGGTLLAGQFLCEMIEKIVSNLNGGAVPDILCINAQLVKTSNKQLQESNLEQFTTELRITAADNLYQSLQEKHNVLLQKFVKELMRVVICFNGGEREEIVASFKEMAEEELNRYSRELCAEKMRECKSLSTDCVYESPGALDKLCGHYAQIVFKISSDTFLGPQRKILLEELATQHEKEKNILRLQDKIAKLSEEKNRQSIDQQKIIQAQIDQFRKDRQQMLDHERKSRSNELKMKTVKSVLSHTFDVGLVILKHFL